MHQTADLFFELVDINSAKFVSFTYRSKGTKELAKYTLIVGFITENLYKRDVEILKDLIDNKKVSGIKLLAAQELLDSRYASLELGVGNNPEYTCKDVYGQVADSGVKVHVIDGEFHVMGLVESKVTIEKGEYKVVNHRPKTIAKNEIRDLLPSERIRQFKLRNVLGARLNGQTLEIDTDPDVGDEE